VRADVYPSIARVLASARQRLLVGNTTTPLSEIRTDVRVKEPTVTKSADNPESKGDAA